MIFLIFVFFHSLIILISFDEIILVNVIYNILLNKYFIKKGCFKYIKMYKYNLNYTFLNYLHNNEYVCLQMNSISDTPTKLSVQAVGYRRLRLFASQIITTFINVNPLLTNGVSFSYNIRVNNQS